MLLIYGRSTPTHLFKDVISPLSKSLCLSLSPYSGQNAFHMLHALLSVPQPLATVLLNGLFSRVLFRLPGLAAVDAILIYFRVSKPSVPPTCRACNVANPSSVTGFPLPASRQSTYFIRAVGTLARQPPWCVEARAMMILQLCVCSVCRSVSTKPKILKRWRATN